MAGCQMQLHILLFICYHVVACGPGGHQPSWSVAAAAREDSCYLKQKTEAMVTGNFLEQAEPQHKGFFICSLSTIPNEI